MSYQCHACPRVYKETRGLSQHLLRCLAARREQEEAERLAKVLHPLKRARHNDSQLTPDPGQGSSDTGTTGAAVPDAADITMLPEPESPPPSISFSGRRRKVPRALKDYIPHSLVGLPSHLRPVPAKTTVPPPAELNDPSPVPTPEPDPGPDDEDVFTTEPNGFGLYRQYTRKPHSDPEEILTLEDLVNDTVNAPEQHKSAPITETPPSVTPPSVTVTNANDWYHPFSNITMFRYIHWYLGVSRAVSAVDLDRLASEVILADDFNRDDFRNFSAARELARLDQYGTTDIPFAAADGWEKGSVTLNVPNTKHQYASESESPKFHVSGIHYRPLIEVIKAACRSPRASKYHWIPFQLFHQSHTGPLRVYTDIYNSDAMLEEDAKIKSLQGDLNDDPDVEAAILAILLWSDSTHLATFGTASLWPVYMYLGNLSKYDRGRPNARAAYHMAYIPSVSLDPDLLN